MQLNIDSKSVHLQHTVAMLEKSKEENSELTEKLQRHNTALEKAKAETSQQKKQAERYQAKAFQYKKELQKLLTFKEYRQLLIVRIIQRVNCTESQRKFQQDFNNFNEEQKIEFTTLLYKNLQDHIQ